MGIVEAVWKGRATVDFGKLGEFYLFQISVANASMAPRECPPYLTAVEAAWISHSSTAAENARWGERWGYQRTATTPAKENQVMAQSSAVTWCALAGIQGSPWTTGRTNAAFAVATTERVRTAKVSRMAAACGIRAGCVDSLTIKPSMRALR